MPGIWLKILQGISKYIPDTRSKSDYPQHKETQIADFRKRQGGNGIHESEFLVSSDNKNKLSSFVINAKDTAITCWQI